MLDLPNDSRSDAEFEHPDVITARPTGVIAANTAGAGSMRRSLSHVLHPSAGTRGWTSHIRHASNDT